MQEQANTEEAKAKALVADDETDARMEYIVISILAEVNSFISISNLIYTILT